MRKPALALTPPSKHQQMTQTMMPLMRCPPLCHPHITSHMMHQHPLNLLTSHPPPPKLTWHAPPHFDPDSFGAHGHQKEAIVNAYEDLINDALFANAIAPDLVCLAVTAGNRLCHMSRLSWLCDGF